MSTLPLNPNTGLDEVYPNDPILDDMVRYIAFDPGKRIGVATFTRKGVLKNNATYHINDFEKLMAAMLMAKAAAQSRPSMYTGFVYEVICEDFYLRSDKALEQSGSRMEVSQAIGMIRLFVAATGSTLTYQNAQILRSTASHHGIKIPKEGVHIPDDKSALLHGLHYIEKKGVIKKRLPQPSPYDL